ncbi:DUF5317 family protein [Neomoorella mulderi]|uniref:DUF5317 domain-containing protein n=1 Tax=Moorella mulderi DSM 14980 TaxID=1122241 RepID=A0A151B092_9FIRM|nr:DUF5317 family protein [Moorella mulderi]KYH33318.1 hypothetical protein MOMUL_00190 [Moorella mulderi DSM 14980]
MKLSFLSLVPFIAFIIGKAMGGSFKKMIDEMYKLDKVGFGFVGMIILDLTKDNPEMIPYAWIAGHLFAFIFFWANRRNVPLLIVGVGMFLNFFVVTANGFAMPVEEAHVTRDPELMNLYLKKGLDPLHAFATNETRFYFLSDVVYLPRLLWFHPSVVSPGDLVKAVGALFLIPTLMLRKKE